MVTRPMIYIIMQISPGSCEKRLGKGFLCFRFTLLARRLTKTNIVIAQMQMKMAEKLRIRKVIFVITYTVWLPVKASRCSASGS